uniref:Uncharacterized protein n=1 Tax=Lepeophtheirus salmonis TaxID=72036 RepID=A0A0K2TPL1_LEPSM
MLRRQTTYCDSNWLIKYIFFSLFILNSNCLINQSNCKLLC